MGNSAEPAWQIELPSGPAQPVPEVRSLGEAWRDVMVEHGVYTQEEMDAQSPKNGAEISWAAPGLMAGPLTTVARVEGKVIAGVELWRQFRDRFWFLEGLIRDQAPEFKGVGADVVGAAFNWWMDKFGDSGEPLRVHSMVREKGSVHWWTSYIGRPPDFTDAFVRNGDYYFEAVGWVLDPG